jgi:hypothetical protein
LPNGFFTAEEKKNTLLPNRRCISIFRFLNNIFTFWQQHFDEIRDFSNHLKPLFMCLLKTTIAQLADSNSNKLVVDVKVYSFAQQGAPP